MSCSKPVEKSVAERTLEILEKQVKQNEKLLNNISSLLEKVGCAEMRQTHASAEGADAARMLLQYLKGNSALWSSHGQEAILEMTYKAGNLQAIEYAGVFAEKDKRRTEWAVAVFWHTFVQKSSTLRDIFEGNGEYAEGIYKFLPSFRATMLENARTKDNELARDNIKTPSSGSYFEVVNEALGVMPAGLEYLHELCLPLNKKYNPITEDGADASDARDHIPEKVKEFVQWAEGMDMVSRTDKAEATTQFVVKWCWYIKGVADKLCELNQDAYNARCEEYDPESDKKRAETDKLFFDAYLKVEFPHFDDINSKHGALQAKKAAAKKAEGSGDAAAEGAPTQA